MSQLLRNYANQLITFLVAAVSAKAGMLRGGYPEPSSRVK